MAHRGCEVCKKDIDPERAAALPTTRLCIDCARLIAKYGGEFKAVVNQDKTSKEGSMKKNFGGVTTRLRRNKDGIQKLRDDFERGLLGDHTTGNSN